MFSNGGNEFQGISSPRLLAVLKGRHLYDPHQVKRWIHAEILYLEDPGMWVFSWNGGFPPKSSHFW